MVIDEYDLYLSVDFDEATVNGLETVTVEGSGPTLRLDAVRLEVSSVRVDERPASFSHDTERGELVVHGLPARSSRVEVAFKKRISDDVIFGLYKSKYGKDYFLATDLEPSEARTVFPCKDNPAYKSVFKVRVSTSADLSVIFNTEARGKESEGGGRQVWTFAPTPRMSTYLFFLGIGRFDEAHLKAGKVDVVAASRPGGAARTAYILKESAEMLKDYGRYFGVGYPLSKLHLVALPEYHTGAMENWGAIASREDYLLLDEKSSETNRRVGAYVMAHEVAHQWFGDLVTMQWWDDLWLNESFATLMETKMVDRLHPEWRGWDDFVRGDVLGSMRTDSLTTTHPVKVKVKNAEEATQVFDNISYGKGAAVLRMVESYLGEENFREGVSSYLKEFSFSNARGEDLWLSLERASGKPVSKLLGPWILRPGFPVVEVRWDGRRLHFNQRRFTLNGTAAGGPWPIPLGFEVNGKKESRLLDGRSWSLEVPRMESLCVNPGHVGYYAVKYDEACYELIASSFPKLDAATRGGMLGDLYLFLLAGMVDPRIYFEFVKLCDDVNDYLATGLVTGQMGLLNGIADESGPVREAALSFLRAQSVRLGVSTKPGEDGNLTSLRERVNAQRAVVDPAFARRLAGRFGRYARLNPNDRLPVLVGFIVADGRDAAKELTKMAIATDDEAERTEMYAALMSSRDPSVIEETLELGISGKVSRSDSGPILVGAIGNPRARGVAFEWVRKRYDRLSEIFAGSQQFYIYMDRVLSVCGVDREKEALEFLTSARTKKGEMTYRMTRELLRANARLRRSLLRA